MRGIDLSSVRSVASTDLVKNLNADKIDGLDGTDLYTGAKNLRVDNFKLNKWIRIGSVVGVFNTASILLSTSFYQGNQAVIQSYIISFGYDHGRVIQISTNAYGVNGVLGVYQIKIRIVKRDVNSFYIDIKNPFQYTSTTIHCNAYFKVMDICGSFTANTFFPEIEEEVDNVMATSTGYPNIYPCFKDLNSITTSTNSIGDQPIQSSDLQVDDRVGGGTELL